MMSLAEAAGVLGASVRGADARFDGVSTDTRTLRSGELFVALRGERFDGHAFLEQAAAAKAAAAIVDRDYSGQAPLPVAIVADTRLALGTLARHWRARFRPVLIAVAGSNGKTTVKEMLASILRSHASQNDLPRGSLRGGPDDLPRGSLRGGPDAVLATTGNLNNDIGVPLTLLRMRATHRWCAIELGMNHKGEIAYLADIARPTVALVNNAQREHLEFMGSVEEVAAENAAVYQGLPADGVAVVNADDGHAAFFRSRAGGRRIVDFGLQSTAQVTARHALKPLSSELAIRTPDGEAPAILAIPGLHNVRNALAAAAAASAVGVDVRTIANGLTAFRPYTGRLQVKQARGGATVIDDSYNANPDSVRAAIDVLASCPGPTVLVLGDMGEVGAQGPEFHREIGVYARARGIGSLLALGEAAREAAQAFGAGGRHFDKPEDLVPHVKGRSILVKGSRFMRMERVVAALTGAAAEGGH